LAELIVSGFAALPFSIARRSGRSTLRSSEWNTWREHKLGETPKPTPGVMLLGCGSSAKNCQGEKGDQNTEQRTRDGKPEGNIPAGALSD